MEFIFYMYSQVRIIIYTQYSTFIPSLHSVHPAQQLLKNCRNVPIFDKVKCTKYGAIFGTPFKYRGSLTYICIAFGDDDNYDQKF